MPSITATVRTGLLALSALALAATGILPPAAAGPDDGRPIATASHLDSPQVSYADGQLTLTSKGNIAGRSGYIHPLDSHIVYSGTGYNGRTGAQQYLFTIPDDPAFAFLNAAGQTWYMAPQVPVGNHEPIWIGFGGDTSIPADKLRDGMVYLDLIGVRGPGRVEALGFYRDGETWHTSRMLSSNDPAFRSLAVYPGDHTHNATLFSRPGRYELTYQASARLSDGTIVRSRPTVQTWQVGGAKPAATATPSLAEAFAAAPAGQPATPYTFTAAPTPGELTGREDGRLTTFSFDAHDPKARGTLNLSLNGFHFTDIPVRDGKASASYYAGGGDSTLQATFVPEAGSAVPRWRSEPLAFSAAARTASASSQAAEAPPVAEQPAPSPRLDFPEHAPTDRSYTITVTPLGGDRYRTDLTFADTAIRGKMTGGIFEPGAEYPWDVLDSSIGLGRATKIIERSSSAPDQFLRVDVKPHSTMDFTPFNVTVPGTLPLTEPVTLTGTIGEPAPSPEPTATPSTTASPTAAPEQWASCVGDRMALSRGHVDLAATLKDGSLSASLRDDTALVEPGSVQRDIADVALVVTDAARYTRPRELAGSDYNYLGPLGSVVYHLPAIQQKGIIWPGWNTQGVDYSKLAGGVRLNLANVNGPGDLRIATPGAPGEPPSLVFDSAAGPHSIAIDHATHVHASWVFTKPGVYTAELSFQATAADGSTLASPPRQLRFIVGNGTTCENGTPAPTPSAEPSPEPTTSSQAPHPAGPPPHAAPPAQLPITGASAPLGLGALLLAAGATMLALRRRTHAG